METAATEHNSRWSDLFQLSQELRTETNSYSYSVLKINLHWGKACWWWVGWIHTKHGQTSVIVSVLCWYSYYPLKSHSRARHQKLTKCWWSVDGGHGDAAGSKEETEIIWELLCTDADKRSVCCGCIGSILVYSATACTLKVKLRHDCVFVAAANKAEDPPELYYNPTDWKQTEKTTERTLF